jgi:signal transduction histidine kinase
VATIQSTSVSVPAVTRARPVRMFLAVVSSLVTITVGVLALQPHAHGGLSAVDGVVLGLAIVWSLVGVVEARESEQTPAWLVLGGSLVAAVALCANRLAASEHAAIGHQTAAGLVSTLAGLFVVGIVFHVLLSLPDGRLRSGARQTAVAVGYLATVGTGLAFVIRHRPVSVLAGALCWALAAVCAVPATRRRYTGSLGPERERLQWIGIGMVLAGDVALAAGVLHLLVAWPGSLAAVAISATILIPLGVMGGQIQRLAPHGGRLFVHALSIVGFTVVVSAVYFVIILGLGHAPKDPAGRRVLGLSILAAAVAAVAYLPAQRRLVGSATRFVYGSRQAPDEVLRTFGSRLTRAVAMDELLLQMAESLRKTMALTSAEVYTGAGDVLERVVSVPDKGSGTLVFSPRERPVISRAGLSGSAWVSVWLPDLLNGRTSAQLRVAPISHAGELLGLIVIERPPRSDAFSEEDDRVLTELARQVGLALHNVQLDATLQTTLDELRKQAEELRESRSRIVASGDAERRRVERDLHDGAQQHLVAHAINLRLVRDIMTEDPKAAAEMLDELAADIQDTIHELRELAHGIYPPLLADSGLVAAMRAAANRSTLDVDVIDDGIGRYSSEIEAAVYFCCLEALQNAAKHAPESRVQVRLWEESGGLLFSVSDDGPGLDLEHATRGQGLVNMTDRLGAIGGTVRWESRPGEGLRVRGSVPLV